MKNKNYEVPLTEKWNLKRVLSGIANCVLNALAFLLNCFVMHTIPRTVLKVYREYHFRKKQIKTRKTDLGTGSDREMHGELENTGVTCSPWKADFWQIINKQEEDIKGF